MAHTIAEFKALTVDSTPDEIIDNILSMRHDKYNLERELFDLRKEKKKMEARIKTLQSTDEISISPTSSSVLDDESGISLNFENNENFYKQFENITKQFKELEVENRNLVQSHQVFSVCSRFAKNL